MKFCIVSFISLCVHVNPCVYGFFSCNLIQDSRYEVAFYVVYNVRTLNVGNALSVGAFSNNR